MLTTILVVGTIAIIGCIAIHDCRTEIMKMFAAFVSILNIILLTLLSSVLTINQGKSVMPSPPKLFSPLSIGTTYSVIAVTDGFAVITDGKEESWLSRVGQPKQLNTWLVSLVQTNLVVGKKYMLGDNPNSLLVDQMDSVIFFEINP